MTEFGHNHGDGRGLYFDGWGAGPYILTVSNKTFRFEDSDRFGPVPVGLDGEPTSQMYFPARSPFWKAWERWKLEGRQTAKGRKGRHDIVWEYCVFSDLRKESPVYSGGAE